MLLDSDAVWETYYSGLLPFRFYVLKLYCGSEVGCFFWVQYVVKWSSEARYIV